MKKAPSKITTGRCGYCKCSNNLAIMGYNRRNILKRIIEIQNVTIEHTKRGVSQKWVYENIVFPRFYISSATYYNYLAVNAKAELRKMKEAEEAQLKFKF